VVTPFSFLGIAFGKKCFFWIASQEIFLKSIALIFDRFNHVEIEDSTLVNTAYFSA
jgi:hypothetical protein